MGCVFSKAQVYLALDRLQALQVYSGQSYKPRPSKIELKPRRRLTEGKLYVLGKIRRILFFQILTCCHYRNF